MVSGYQIMLTTVSVEILCTLWSYNLHKICKLPSCLLQTTHSNTQSKLSVLVRLSFCFFICCLQVDRHSTPGLERTLFASFCFYLLTVWFTFTLRAVSVLLQPENLAFTGRFQLKIIFCSRIGKK